MKKLRMPIVTASFMISQEQDKKLSEIAKKKLLNRSVLVRKALDLYLKRIEKDKW